ncbi:cupin domain-containing protein [Motilibacter aurantiacus]|uniref:cupin domain-containing protein n=1 Tax=Motilibacter aurantiacus TaxID=2714955 RepID=UPI001409E9A5|nr:cupin domain-containing protein [Motilibacter aurantiacus]NHC45232.1 cupin [Motilibacter aurantiacus]
MTQLVDGLRRADATSRPALGRCIAVPAAEFAADYWGRSALLTRAAELAGGFEDLLSLDDVDELVSRRGLRTPFLRVAKDGQVIDPKRWTGGGGAGAEVSDQVQDDALTGLFADGASLVLQGLHRTWPPIVEFAAALAAELGHPVQANAYITPPQSRGFDPHYDVHDVFVLQLSGEKRWRIHRPVLEHPLRSQPWTDRKADVAAQAQGEPFLDTVLRPGDVLYLPRGWLHAAEALGDVSAHLTIGIHTVTRYALVEALTGLAARSPQLRTSLPLGVDVADPEQLREDLAATLEALAAAVRDVPAEDVAARLRRQVWPQTRPAPVSPIRQAAASRSVAADTVVRLRPALHARLAPGDGEVTLLLRGRQLTLPAATRAALEDLLSGEPRSVGRLPGLEPDEAVVLVGRLLREAVVVPA